MQACSKRRTQRRESTNYVSLLRSASKSGSLSDAKRIHEQLRGRLKHSTYLSNLVIHMYAYCGGPEEARSIFDAMVTHDIFSWNFMLKSYIKSGDEVQSLQFFAQMRQEAMMPNKFLYVTLLSLFTNHECILQGKYIHACVAKGEYSEDVILQTGLVSMYSKCGNLESARWIFDRMHQRDAASWNALIAGYAQYGSRKESIQLLFQMREQGLVPNAATVVSLLSSCSNPVALSDGKCVHSLVKGTELESDAMVGNALISMYGKCDSLEDASKTFNEMSNCNKVTFLNMLMACACKGSLLDARKVHDHLLSSGLEVDIVTENVLINMYGKCAGLQEAQEAFNGMNHHNLISWNALLSAYAQNEDSKGALCVFRQMLEEGMMPNKITFVSTVDACSSSGDLKQGKWFHASIAKSEYEFDVVLGTAFIHMYGKSGVTEDAQDIFDNLDERDIPCWNAVITVYSQHDKNYISLILFNQMLQEGALPDKITFVSVLTACNSEMFSEEGKKLHAYIAFTGLAMDIIVENAIINMYGKCSTLEDAMNYFNTIIKRDNVSFINIFSICANKAALHEGCCLHDAIRGTEIEADVVVGNAIINMYGKCGSLEIARSFFNKMPQKNVVTWNGILSVYAQNGLGETVLNLFREMRYSGVIPNAVTLVCILSACSHTGLVEEGYGYFYALTRDHKIAVNHDHFNCMVDLLARSGKLEEAEELLKQMPFEPSVVTWTTLLGSCRDQVDVERAARIAQRLLKLNPVKSSVFVTLSNILIASGREDEAALAIRMMRDPKCLLTSSLSTEIE